MSDDPYRIAALQQKRVAQHDVMRAGSGTPWEDRGSSFIGSAFLKTCFSSLFGPAKLLDSLRRPETTSDATAFAWICGIMWSLGIVTNDLITYWNVSGLPDQPQPDRSTYYFSAPTFWLEMVLRMAIVPLALFLFLKLSVAIFSRVSAGELRAVPKTLVQNLFAYALGPSILAIIPPWYIGMPLAALWILIVMIVAARSRLHMSVSGAAVACILSWVSGVALVSAVSAVIWFVWVVPLDNDSLVHIPPPPSHGHS